MSDTLPLQISVTEARSKLADPIDPPILIDCRTKEEHAIARIAGAILVPMDEVAARLGELDQYEDRLVIVYCHHGVRSLQVANHLRRSGISQTVSMRGGIDRWSIEIDPSVPRY